MTHNHVDERAGDQPSSFPSAFKYILVVSALFIAGVSAFFSVRGLGLLFVGSATAVMIMAASLEVGKLVAASFLYRYWDLINRALKVYLVMAVLALIAITSLGNYGYLARAYERTHTQIGLLESQIASIEKEITDTQRQIEGSRGQLTRVSDASREDISKLQQRITQGNESLNQSLTRIQERRKTAQDRRDRDLQGPTQRMTEQGEVLKKAIAAEELAIAGLNDRAAVLDRAVDAYTKEGGAGLFKEDHIKKGHELRDKQRKERDAISAELADHRARIEQLRAEYAKQSEAADREMVAVREQFTQESARLDAEEQEARKTGTESVAQVEKQLLSMQSQGQTVVATGDTQVESLYQRIRSRNEEIHRLRNQIASVDIGSYRFVARAFEAPADDVVKWLILALVIVFDPLAVSLVIGFNMALLRERPRGRSPSPVPAGGEATSQTSTASAPAPRSRWLAWGTGLFFLAAAVGTVAIAGLWGVNTFRDKTRASHGSLIPGESFAVMTVRPDELGRSTQGHTLSDWLGKGAGKAASDAIADLLSKGFDPQADLYAFAKFPAKGKAENNGRPVMLCGFVARVTDPVAVEAALSRIADQLSITLRTSTNAAPSLTRSRAMVRYGTGRYMDPEGGFFTFGLTEQTAIVMIEFEGDPKAPCVEDEIRLCLARPDMTGASTEAREILPPRARNRDGAISLWLDAGRFFSHLPKNPAAQARYQQLERHLGFDMLLTVKPSRGDQFNLVADYAYRAERFKDRQQPTPVQVLASLGPSDEAGIGGRLMDRCLDTLDYYSLIERLRAALAGTNDASAQQVLIEKFFGSDTNAQFILSARYDPQSGPPLVSAMQTIFQ